jgi:predicted secreted protein
MEMQQDLVKVVNARVGESFNIRIWEDRTRGSRWTPEFDSALLRLLNDDFDRTRNIRVSDIGMRYFEFLPIATGKHQIVFEWRYGWKFSAENRLTYEVVVE